MVTKSGYQTCCEPMTIGEKLHRQREAEAAALLEVQGLSLHRQGGMYQIEDSDLQQLSDFLSLSEIIDFIHEWRGVTIWKDRVS